jgi:plasmid stabilization system protein ParE
LPPQILRTPEAHRDLLDIWAYIAREMRLRSRTRCCHASTERWRFSRRAKIGRERPEFSGTPRSFVVRPYVVFYEPLSEDNGIVVWRIIHGARDLQRLIRPPDRVRR